MLTISLTMVSLMITWESSQLLEMKVVQRKGKMELQESMDRCTASSHIVTDNGNNVMLKTTISTKQLNLYQTTKF